MTVQTILRSLAVAGAIFIVTGCETPSEDPAVAADALVQQSSVASSTSLVDQLGVEPMRSAVIADAEALVHKRVKAADGLDGIALTAAYKTIKSVDSGYISRVIDGMLDDCLDALQPLYDDWLDNGTGTFSEYLDDHAGKVADALLDVSDAKAKSASNGAVKSAYSAVRSYGRKYVKKAAGGIGKIIEARMDEASQ